MFLWVIGTVGRVTEMGILSTLVRLTSLVLWIIYRFKISKAFGKSGGFAVGLVLLPLIFFPILAFGNVEYIGPQMIFD